MENQLNLLSIKNASLRFGVSQSFLKRLIASKRLTRYKIGKKTLVSANQFEEIAVPDSDQSIIEK
jgi:excisionase family DNA binding protein